jgi:hypothetical protein
MLLKLFCVNGQLTLYLHSLYEFNTQNATQYFILFHKTLVSFQ